MPELIDQGETRPLELRDPIAVENSGKPIGKKCHNILPNCTLLTRMSQENVVVLHFNNIDGWLIQESVLLSFWLIRHFLLAFQCCQTKLYFYKFIHVTDSGCLLRKDPPSNVKNSKQPRPKQPARGGTVLKGRSRQQFVEVDPIDVDTRFFTKLLLCLVPK